MLPQVRHRPKLSVGVDWQDRDAAVLMVGHQHPASGWIAAQVARLAPKAGLITQLPQPASCVLDVERGHPATIEAHALADGEQEPTLRIERQERGVVDRDGVPKREFSALRILVEGVNPLRPA